MNGYLKNGYLKNIRQKSDKPISLQQKLLRILFVLLLGAALGFIAKYFGSVAVDVPIPPSIRHVVDEIRQFLASYLGFWILIATLIGAWSRSSRAAALHVFIVLASMLCVYYIYEMQLFGFFPTRYFLAWGLLVILSPIGGYVVWFSRGKGWIAAVCAAIPISLLISEWYTPAYFFSIPRGFDLILAVLLFVLLPPKRSQYIRVLPITIVLSFVVEHFMLIRTYF